MAYEMVAAFRLPHGHFPGVPPNVQLAFNGTLAARCNQTVEMAAMDEPRLQLASDESWNEHLAQAIAQGRQRLHELDVRRLSRVSDIEHQLIEQVDRLATQLADEQSTAVAQCKQAQRSQADLTTQQRTLQKRQAELETALQAIAIEREELTTTRAALSAAAAALQQERDQAATERAELEQQRHKLGRAEANRHNRQAKLAASLDQQQADFAQREQMLATTAAEVAKSQSQCEVTRTKLVAREEALTRAAADLETSRARLAADQQEIQVREQQLTRQVAEVAGCQAQLEAGLQQLRSDEEHVSRRAIEVAAAHSELAVREQGIVERAVTQAAAADELARFQTQLAEGHAELQIRAAELSRVESELAQSQAQLASRQDQLSLREAELARLADELAHSRARLEDDRQQVGDREHACVRRHEDLIQRETRLQEERAAVQQRQEECEASATQAKAREHQLTCEADRLAQLESDLLNRQMEIDARVACLAQQQVTMAGSHSDSETQTDALSQLEAELAARLRDFEQREQQAADRQQSLEAELAVQRNELTTRMKRIVEDHDHLTQVGVQLRNGELTLAAEREEFERSRRELADQDSRQQSERADMVAHDEMSAQLTDLRQKLVVQCAANEELERRLATVSENVTSADAERLQAQLVNCQQDLDDLRRKHQMALDDLRTQRTRIADLEKRSTAGSTSTVASTSSGALDWETRKRKLLEALEADEYSEASVGKKGRLQVEEAIRGTEQAIAAKDQEIAELKRVLDEQCNQIGGYSLDQTVIDGDALIQQERQKLAQLRNDWEEKLRQAEIELSLERAKIARERVQIEEKLHQLSEHTTYGNQGVGHAVNATAPLPPQKPTRGRWLARLGLKEDHQ